MKTEKPTFKLSILVWRLAIGLLFSWLSTFLVGKFSPEIAQLVLEHVKEFVLLALLTFTGIDLDNYFRVVRDWKQDEEKPSE